MAKPIDARFEATSAQAMIAELQPYLESDVLFWQVQPNALGSRMPKLTIGGLLEALIWAEAGGAPGMAALRQTLNSVKALHRDRYLARAEQETRSRLNTWSGYLDDYHRAPNDAAGDYPHEVRSRLKVELLLMELEHEKRGGAERLRATALDEIVRGSWKPGAFIWDGALTPFFPSDRFWWLYGKLRLPSDDR